MNLKKKLNKMRSFRNLWVSVAYSSIYEMVVSGGELRKKRVGKKFEEEIAESFSRINEKHEYTNPGSSLNC